MTRENESNGSSSGNSTSASRTSRRLAEILGVCEGEKTHYTDFHLLAEGSFGIIYRAHDTVLGRDVAVKVLREKFREDEEILDRFIKEARATAQLEHPNIMPVHELGFSAERGAYFTMKYTAGRTLKEILDDLREHPGFYGKRYSLTNLLEVFLAVCNGVAFAHSKGVIHRDLKPANIIVGDYGEVLILDWGLVKQVGEKEEEGGVSLRMEELDEGGRTLDGAVSGTPNYMSPEQADGRIHELDFRSDIYSLGAILYHILTHYPPFERMPLKRLLEHVKEGRFEEPRKRRPELKIPKKLEAICLKAMAVYPLQRYRSVEELAEDVRNYIHHRPVKAYRANRWERLWDACRRNPVKSSVMAAVAASLLLAVGARHAALYGSYYVNVRKAQAVAEMGDADYAAALDLWKKLEAIAATEPLKRKTPEEKRLEAELQERADSMETRYATALALYLSVPARFRNRPAVREGYKHIMAHRVEFAVQRRQYDLARRWVNTARAQLQELGGATDDAVAYLKELIRLIEGPGRLTIEAGPSVESVLVWPLYDVDGRMRPGDPVDSGTLPLTVTNIMPGSYMLEFTLRNGSRLPWPVYIDHGEHFTVTPRVPEHIPEEMVYVPAGPFFFGGEDSRFYRRRRIELPAFFIRRYEVTVEEYLEFWKSLRDPERKRAYISRVRFDPKERRFHDAWDENGNLLDPRLKPEYPVVGITLEAAKAFCAWKSRKTGRRLRLPTAEEWEKAARGVDGRRFVWGSALRPDWALVQDNEEGKKKYPYWAPPGSFKWSDVSVYNVYDMAGNVREMTSSPFPCREACGFFQVKGASASTPSSFLPCAYVSDTPVVPSDIGFRYVEEISAEQLK